MSKFKIALVVIGTQAIACALAAILLGAQAQAAPAQKRVCKDHLHTGEAKGYTGGAALMAQAKQNWSVVVTQHDGASWANLDNASSKSGNCGIDKIVKGKGNLYFCIATARPCRWEIQIFPSVKPPPISSGQQ